MATIEDNLPMEDNLMNGFKIVLALAVVAGICFAVTTPTIQAQVGVEIGAAPVCPYGRSQIGLNPGRRGIHHSGQVLRTHPLNCFNQAITLIDFRSISVESLLVH